MSYPVAPKTSAAGLSAAVSRAVLYLLQTYAFKGAVPDATASQIYVAMPRVVAFAAAWAAPHQDRVPPWLSDAKPAMASTGTAWRGGGNVVVQPPKTADEPLK